MNNFTRLRDEHITRRSWVLLLGLAIVALVLVSGAHSVWANPGSVTKVYWTDRDNATLSVTDLSNNQTQVLVTNIGGRLQDVDLDANTGILYFSDWGPVGFPGSQGTINQVNKDGTGLTPVCGAGTLGDAVHQLALDTANSQIYFTRAVSYDNHEVSRVNYGLGCTGHTVSFLAGGFGGPGWFPSGLAHDPVNDILYWGDIGVINNAPNGSVNQMTASTLSVGPLPTQLTPHVTGRGRGFALDQASQTIFVTAHDPLSPGTGGAVFAYNIGAGTETQIIPAAGVDPNTGYWDIEIDPIGQRIWYTAYGAGEIRSAEFDGSDVQVELSGLTNPYGLALELESLIDVDLDIKPGSDPNSINTKSMGIVPVAALGSASFDVTDIDVTTLLFGSCGGEVGTPAHDLTNPVTYANHLQDVNNDGFTDLVSHYRQKQTGLAVGDTVACLVGATNGGTPITGTDAVNIVK